jgi:hypothetical protein
MNIILERCPSFEEATEANTTTGPVLVRAYQMVLWVSLSVRGVLSRSFPAILDTGHNHNFSIREEHLDYWAGLNPRGIRTVGHVRMNKQMVELKDAAIAIYLNMPGKRDELLAEEPYLPTLTEGVAIHRSSDPYAPRLPLLGLRALVRNKLRLTIDGGRREASLVYP